MTYNYSKTFFSKKRAESFQAELRRRRDGSFVLFPIDELEQDKRTVPLSLNLSRNSVLGML